MEDFPYAWIFFVIFIFITTFFVLNLFIGIVVNSMHEMQEQEARAKALAELSAARGAVTRDAQLRELVRRLEGDLALVRSLVQREQ